VIEGLQPLLAAGLPSWSTLVAELRLDLLLKLLLAVLLGGVIGLEREIAGKPAGLRTNILICIGAALLTDVSIEITRGKLPGTQLGDPSRLAAQIVSGIGFIGAGTIMQARGTVTGLTSAATIWVVAAIGITVGAGKYLEATGAGLLVAIVLAGLGTLEHKLRRARRVLGCTIRTRIGFPADELERALGASGIKILEKHVFDHAEDRVFELKLSGPARQFDIVSDKLMRIEGILGIVFT
jgi:putative Mg2+ transporter-C (MgtC) family protein